MEQRELLLLEKYAAVNPELKELWEDHILYEKQERDRALLAVPRFKLRDDTSVAAAQVEEE